MQGSCLGSSGSNHHGIPHCVILLEGLDELSNSRALLANGDVDTVELLGLVGGVVPALLVQDGVKANGSLAGLTVTDDQLTLAATDGNHGIDRLEAGLDRLVDRLARQNTMSLDLGAAGLLIVERTLAIDGVAEGVDDTTEQLRTDRDRDLSIC